MRKYLAGLILVSAALLYAVTAGAGLFFLGGAHTGSNPNPPPAIFTAISLSCGGSCTFTSGVAGTVGMATATMTGGSFTGSWSLQLSGFDHAGTTCVDYTTPGYLSINTMTGALTNSSSAPAQSYPGVCVAASQSGATNSPYVQAFTLTGVGSGSLITTATWQNDGTVAAQPGELKRIGQGWRRGDIPSTMHPVARDAVNHVPLPVQQWDYISYHDQNGDDGSWSQSVLSFQLPPTSPQYTSGSLPGSGGSDATACANSSCFQVEYVLASGAYTASGKQTLTAFCAAHPNFNIHLTDVRNGFDDTVRDSGTASFFVCNNISNTGRDAPLHYAAGPAEDGWEVRGMFAYETGGTPNGHKDPELYPVCDLDLATSPTDQTSLGDVQWVCTIHNGWMNVASGSAGNAGNPGPVGLAHDPQGLTYRPEVFDGGISLLNYNNYDASLASANSPFKLTGCVGGAPTCITVPQSTGTNVWYQQQAERFTTTGTAPSGLTNGGLIFISATASWNNQCQGPATTEIAFNSMQDTRVSPAITVTNQGTGTQNFSFRVYHTRFMAWHTLDPSGWENWLPAGTSTRVTRPWRPALTKAERDYWVQSGLISPLITTAVSPIYTTCNDHPMNRSYAPMGWGIVIGGTGGSDRPDLEFPNGWADAAFLNETSLNWNEMRWFDLAQTGYDFGDMLNEASGRIPVLNNGPPTGPGGGGGGGSYPILGAPMPNVGYNGSLDDGYVLSTDAGAGGTGSGSWGFRDNSDHVPGFTDLLFAFFGQKYQLENIEQAFNRTQWTHLNGPTTMGGDDDREIILPNGNHYYDTFANGCCQRRGSFRIYKEVVRAAHYGPNAWPDGTTNPEKTMARDVLTENHSFYNAWAAAIDGPVNYFRTAVIPPASGDGLTDPFFDDYGVNAYHEGYTVVRDPLAAAFLTQWANFYNDACGTNPATHPMLLEYCSPETYAAGVHDYDHVPGLPNTGQYYSPTPHDATDFGLWDNWVEIAANGQITQNEGIIEPLQPGDLVRNIQPWATGTTNGTIIDQMPGTQTFQVIGPIDNTAGTFFVKNPATGTAFTGFTVGGVPLVVNTVASWAFEIRPLNETGPNDWAHFTYAPDLAGISAILNVDKGVTGVNMLPFYNAVIARGGTGPTIQCGTAGGDCFKYFMDPNAVVP